MGISNKIKGWLAGVAKIRPTTPYFLSALKTFYKIHAHKHKFKIVILFLGAIISGVLEILGILALYLMIKLLIKVDSLENSHLISQLFSALDLQSYNSQILFLGAFIAAIFIGKNIFIVTYYMYQHHILRVWKTQLSSKLMRGYLNAPYGFLLGYNSATILRNINSIVSSSLNDFILSSFNFLANLVTGVIILSIIYLKYFYISLIIAAILGSATILQSVFLKKKALKLGEEKNKLLEEQSKNVYQGFHAIKETKVLGKENFFMDAFDRLNYTTMSNDSKTKLLARIPSHVTEIVIIISIVIICITVLTDPQNSNEASVASLGVLAAIAFRIAPIMNRILNSLQAMNKSTSSIKTLFKELDKVNSFQKTQTEKLKKVNFNTKIEFRNVNFTYPKARKLALDKINLSINKGEFIGVVGPSGAGKSTLIDIFLGLLEPTKGNIMVDGELITSENRRSWQDKLALVPQQVFISDDTISNNIAFGFEKDTIDSSQVSKAIKDSQLTDLIDSKKEKEHFIVGENGKRLSGGQKQRLGIARALYYDSEILVLDEATSALDLKTEFEISKLLHKQAGKKTIVAIAHRLSTVIDADKIVYMEDGKIADIGTFEELVSRNKNFSNLAKLAKITPGNLVE